jgi:cytochrome P450
MRMIAEILGAEPERLADFKRWSDDLLLATAGVPTPDQQASLRRTREELNAWVDPIIEERRARPMDDLISALVAAEGIDDVMTAEEVGNLIIILMVAGNETTTNLLGNALAALLAHREQLDAAIADPSLVPGLVEEALRYDAPVQMTFRRATADAKLPGGEIGAGEVVGVLLGSANRDERAFRDPDRFDVRRNAGGHLAFGFGNHFCLGAPLARLEARLAFQILLPRLGRMRCLDADLEYSASLLVRGPRRLRLGLTPG